MPRLLDIGDTAVLWRGPDVVVVANAVGRWVLQNLRAGAEPDDLAEDLAAVSGGDALAHAAAIRGLIQVIDAGERAATEPSAPLDVAAAEAQFLAFPPTPIVDRSGFLNRLAIFDAQRESIGGAGEPVFVATSDGGSELAVVGSVVLHTDGDAAGQRAAARLLHAATNESAPVGALTAADDDEVALVGGPCEDVPAERWARLAAGATVVGSDGRTRAIDRLVLGGDVFEPTTDGGWIRRVDVSDASTGAGPKTVGARPDTSASTRFAHRLGHLLDDTLCARSMKVTPGVLHHDRSLWAFPWSEQPEGWHRLLDSIDAPPVLRSVPIDGTEILVGIDATPKGAVTLKAYVPQPTIEQQGVLDESCPAPASDGGPLIFTALKWSWARPSAVVRADYRMPNAGIDVGTAASTIFGPDLWRWTVAASLLTGATGTTVTGLDTDRRMHTHSFLVATDDRGRRSFDASASMTPGPGGSHRATLRWLAAEAGLVGAERDLLVAFVTDPIERVIGGVTGAGQPFLSLYRTPFRYRSGEEPRPS